MGRIEENVRSILNFIVLREILEYIPAEEGAIMPVTYIFGAKYPSTTGQLLQRRGWYRMFKGIHEVFIEETKKIGEDKARIMFLARVMLLVEYVKEKYKSEFEESGYNWVVGKVF
jgi:hypothetical protein